MDNKSESVFKQMVEHPTTKFVYFAFLLLFVLLILYNMKRASAKENMIGVGSALTAQSLFSGPNIRRLGQEFSATNQGDQTTVYLPDIKEIVPDVLSARSKERLTATPEAPVFWDIGSELAAYQQESSDALKAESAAGQTSAERFSAGSPAAMYQEDVLRNKLYAVGS